ncbi:DegT/DnrJ/EryC1/StrS aminotransferase family protein [Ahrensia sp. 13_GOM-1096m]|uniref:DegT/DnrJ/EryC1/StrS family aminotransferase n=1 Tax=Ahrensia sp. 13_GOM-1096m TaxID=1380380 RepID=UPI000550ADBD|nr:DegT/DnrJ/EryC1/StrS family aminotransferase [Ahrensia sp. 13_GOM-1096m]
MSAQNIQVLKPKFEIEETLNEIRQCLEIGWTGAGFKTVEMEEAWKKYTDLPHAHFVASATAALHIAVAILKLRHNWKDGDEIVSTGMTFISTNHAIAAENMKPIFADIDSYGCMDPESLESKIGPKTRAVIFVGLGGNTGQLEKIVEICNRHNVKLILDAAHMAGTTLNGECPAKLVDITCYSFQAVKNLPTGDAGMICCMDAELDAMARKFAWLGISQDTYSRTGAKGDYKWMYDIEYLGYKYNGNAIMAAIGLVALRHLDEQNAYRRQISAWYRELLGGHEGIELIEMAPNCQASQHLCQILVQDRDKMMQDLYAEGIFPGVHYRDNTQYKMYSYGQGTVPKTAYFSNHILSLPLHLHLEKADIKRITRAVINSISEG